MKKSSKKVQAAVSIFTSVAVVISIMAPVLTLAPQTVYADSEGYYSADDSASVAFTGTDHVWSHPERAETDNGSYATTTITNSSNTSEYLKVYDFDFTIPSNATINGIEVEIERHEACAEQSCTSHIRDYRVRLIKAGTIGSTDYAKTTTNWGSSDSDAVYGGSGDLWGTTWSASDINHHDTGVVLSVTRTTGGDRTAYVDYIKMKVYYTPCTDNDQDGYYAGDGSCGPIDCNDSNAGVNPSATEICDGSIDDNCDGTVDEGCDCTNGFQQQCGSTDIGECAFGAEVCTDGAWGSCSGNIEPGTELCNGLDDDCDSLIDEDFNIGQTCAVGIGSCETAGQNVCTQDHSSAECSAQPGQPGTEICNGLDDDCDGVIDEGDVCVQEGICGDGDVNSEGEQCDGTDMGQAPEGNFICSSNCKLIPVYESEGTECPQGTTPEKVGDTHTIEATDADGIGISLTTGKTYLFRASGTFVPTSPQGWFSDAGYTTIDNWSNIATQYGIQGTGNDYAAHALLGDLGYGVGVINWGTYNSVDHIYNFVYTVPINDPEFVIGDRYSDWFITPWQNQSGMNDNSGSLSLEIYECKPTCGNGTCGDGENCENCSQDCGECNTPGYCGMYFNHVPDGQDFQGPITGLNPGDSPFNHPAWWDIAKLVFIRTDSALNFGNNFLPVNQGYAGDPFHFTAKWQAKLIVPANGNYGYSLRSDDDSWLYIDGVMEKDLGGVHAPTTRTGSVYLTQGEHTLNLYFAERHTTQSYLDFHWTTSGIETIADCEEYCGDGTCNGRETCGTCAIDCGECPVAKCGDGIINQTSEQCDGQSGVTEHYICTSECILQYVPYCGDKVCDNDETCTTCEGDCGLCPCDPNQELITDGGFETPVITNGAGWDIFDSGDLASWIVEWVSSLPSEWNGFPRPTNAFLELQNGVAGDAHGGTGQLVEMDSDWAGPNNPLNGEPASAKIYQEIQTIPGRDYTITFYFSPRPNTSLENNSLQFSWDNVLRDTISGAGENNTNWVKKEYTLTATGTTTRIQFADAGVPSDSLGTYLDDVSVRCCQAPVGCQPGATESCSTGLYGICAAGTRTCGERAVWGECVQNNQPVEEICDQLDNDCDNTVDEDLICTGRISTVITGGGGGGGGGHLVVCGDGTRELNEMCDDGNIIDGDGCSSTCGVEVVLGASTQQGEVLGESTTLPQTGEDAIMLIISSIIVALGAGFGLKKKLSI
jgi:fibro-slime domain-containing protein/LPXTG-motif cell wall-anchored protein